MTEIADTYRTRADAFAALIERTTPEQWDNPSPCEGWVARDVVVHVVEFSAQVLRERAGVDVDPVPAVADDPAAAFARIRAAVQQAFDDPETLQAFCEEVHGREGLRELYLPTICDVSMTSLGALTNWKARVLEQLYLSADQLFTSEGAPHGEARLEEVRSTGDGRAAWGANDQSVGRSLNAPLLQQHARSPLRSPQAGGGRRRPGPRAEARVVVFRQ